MLTPFVDKILMVGMGMVAGGLGNQDSDIVAPTENIR